MEIRHRMLDPMIDDSNNGSDTDSDTTDATGMRSCVYFTKGWYGIYKRCEVMNEIWVLAFIVVHGGP